MSKINKGLFTSDKKDWYTPQDLFDTLDAEFHFKLDPCATAENAKCPIFFTEKQNGLSLPWQQGGAVFMNPPYGKEIKFWMEKAYEAFLEGVTVVCLVPARTDTRWWHDYAMKGEIRLVKGRLKFGGVNTSAPFPSAVIILKDGVQAKQVKAITRLGKAINAT